jgi:nitrate/nitrite-specific signal transduction histidine kinase
VKKIQGEPYSIQDYDVFGEEVWSYGENGVATITFKDGKVKSFRNYQQVLKIGNNSTLDKDNDEATSKEKLWSELTEKANSSGSTVTEETAKSNTDLYGSGSQNIKAYPNQYEEMAEAKGLNPYAMPDDITLQQMQKEYERKKYLKWGLITIGAIGILYLLFRMIIKKKHA